MSPRSIVNISNIVSNKLLTRQSAAELRLEEENEASFVAKYKWLIIGSFLALVLNILAAWLFLKWRRAKRARRQEAERGAAKQAELEGGNAWGGGNLNANGTVGGNVNVWSIGNARAINTLRPSPAGVDDVPPAYDGRRMAENEQIAGGRI